MLDLTPPVDLSVFFPPCRAQRRLAHQGFERFDGDCVELLQNPNDLGLVVRGLLRAPFGKTKSYAIAFNYRETCNVYDELARSLDVLMRLYTDEERAEITRLGEEFDALEH